MGYERARQAQDVAVSGPFGDVRRVILPVRVVVQQQAFTADDEAERTDDRGLLDGQHAELRDGSELSARIGRTSAPYSAGRWTGTSAARTTCHAAPWLPGVLRGSHVPSSPDVDALRTEGLPATSPSRNARRSEASTPVDGLTGGRNGRRVRTTSRWSRIASGSVHASKPYASWTRLVSAGRIAVSRAPGSWSPGRHQGSPVRVSRASTRPGPRPAARHRRTGTLAAGSGWPRRALPRRLRSMTIDGGWYLRRQDTVASAGEPPRHRTAPGTAARRSALRQQLGMRAALHDAAALVDQDQVGAQDRRQPVGDGERGPALHGALDGRLDEPLADACRGRWWPRRG